MSSESNSPTDDYFNDLSRTTASSKRPRSSDANGGSEAVNGADTAVPKPKRIACIICRKRKLKCDGSKPSCSTCTRLGHDCAYDEVRKKSGPKRGYVKALEERLKQVETLLKTQDPAAKSPDEISSPAFNTLSGNLSAGGLRPISTGAFNVVDPSLANVNGNDAERWAYHGESPQPPMETPMETNMGFDADLNMGMGIEDTTFTWEMIGLGLEEPLPPQESVDELHQIYFEKIHPSIPMIHKFRYLAAMSLQPSLRPPVALRYAMWTLAASVTGRYMDLRDHFYHRARKYVELDYVKGHGEHMISIAHAQTHILLACFEFKMMYFPRAWMSTGSATRMCQMMSLHKLDGTGLDVKQCLPPPRDWTEREERRRTFWMAFAEDRYASIGTGWPMTIDERDILTNLPASDEAFDMSRAEVTMSLPESMTPAGASKLSAFGGVALMACLFGRNLIHLHRPGSDDRDHDLNGEFWKRHRAMDNILLNTALSMPSHLKLPSGLSSPNIVFTNMNIHTSTICLHQAAIYKADKNRLAGSIAAESKVRCINAANEIASIMRLISHMDLASMNPFMAFCLYVAARVFVQYLKTNPNDGQITDSLRFLLSAMNALKRKNPLTESFLVQLDVDLEGLGMNNPEYKKVFAYSADNLGISSAKMPTIGQTQSMRDGLRRNQCNFLQISEVSAETPKDNSSPTNISASTTHSTKPSNTRTNSFESMEPTGTSGWSLPSGTLLPGSAADRQQSTLVDDIIFGSPLRNPFPPLNDRSPSGYGPSDSSNTGLSPDGAPSSRPTPNSTNSSDTHASCLHPNAQSRTHSYEASPVPSHQRPSVSSTTTDTHSRSSLSSQQAFFSGATSQTDFCMPSGTGFTPAASESSAFAVPDTPGKNDFSVPPGWEVTGQAATGLTPVGEGVFRTLMGLGPLDEMDLGWEDGG